MDQNGNYMAPFDPDNWGWRNSVNSPNEVIGKFGPLKIHVKDILIPAFGKGNSAITLASENNPIEFFDRYHVKPGQVEMLITMAGKDNFNLNTQAQSFIYLAEHRGFHIDTHTIPNGGHNVSTAQKMIPTVFSWLNNKLAQFN